MFGIHEPIYERMMAYFRDNSSILEVVLFGSRATGRNSAQSDIDLCIKATTVGRGSLVLDVQDLVGVYSCDIVFADKVSGEIGSQIQRDGIVIYSR